jgi:GntR family transcriptional regulator
MRGRAVDGTGTKHEQVAALVRRMIDSGELRPGDRVPTIEQLEQRTGFGRDAVMKGLATLREAEGLIRPATHGRGHEVVRRQLLSFNPRESENMSRRRSAGADAWTTDVAAQGHKAGQIITVGIEPSSTAIARLLEIEPGSPVVQRRRLRTVNGYPHNTADSIYPMWLAQKLPRVMMPDDVPEGVIAYLASEGYVQAKYRDRTEARMPTKQEADKLEITGSGVPVLVHTRTGVDAEGKPLRVTVTVWRGDRTEFTDEIPA